MFESLNEMSQISSHDGGEGETQIQLLRLVKTSHCQSVGKSSGRKGDSEDSKLSVISQKVNQ